MNRLLHTPNHSHKSTNLDMGHGTERKVLNFGVNLAKSSHNSYKRYNTLGEKSGANRWSNKGDMLTKTTKEFTLESVGS